MKVELHEIKKNHREAIVERMKPIFTSTICNIRRKKTFNQNSKKTNEFKNEDNLRSLCDIFKCTNI